MAVGKTNPLRQMMINMMYLVLTALLALNVSAEILKAFQTVNEGMEKSIHLIDDKNFATMKMFDKLLKSSPATTQKFYDLAEETNATADTLFNYVDRLIDRVIEESGGTEIKTTKEGIEHEEMKGMKNLEVPARMFIEEKKGDELQEKVNTARAEFIDIVKQVETIDFEEFEPNITVKTEKKDERSSKTWAEESFHMVPAIAAVTLLTKIQQDIRSTQANIIDRLLQSIGAEEMSFDELLPIVQTDKSAVAVGETFSAKVLLAAYDSKQDPEIYIGGEKFEVSNGMASYEVTPRSQGPVEKEVKIVVKNKKTGEEKSYFGTLKYDVFNAPAIISATKMNVVYVGLKNPIEVSVPGFKPEDISARASTGSLVRKRAGEYELSVPDTRGRVKEINISAIVKMPDGSSKNMGSKEFRIKYVPAPTPYFGSKESGEISPGEIRLVNFISVRLENFAFDGLKYRVDRYTIAFVPKKGNSIIQNVSGAKLPGNIKGILMRANRGDRIIVENIYASAPGPGRKRLPTGIILTVK